MITLVHGPGCPVCVTPLELIDRAIAIARAARRHLHLVRRHAARARHPRPTCSSVKARGGDVRIVYSPLDAVKLAQKHPDREVVFFAVGFETTAPANAMAVWQARAARAHELLDPRARTCWCRPRWRRSCPLPDNRVQGFLAAGHVCTVMGYEEYEPIAARYRVPIVVTGFEPLDLLQGIYHGGRGARGGPRRGREPVRARGDAAKATGRRRS